MVTRATASPRLLRRYGELVVIKARYGVNTWDAHHYITALHLYDRIRKTLRKSIGYRFYEPTAEEIGRVSLRMKDLVEALLTLVAVRKSTPKNLSLASRHQVLSCDERSAGIEWRNADAAAYVWEFNYPLFLEDYALAMTVSYARGDHAPEANSAAMRFALDRAVQSEDPYLFLAHHPFDAAVRSVGEEEGEEGIALQTFWRHATYRRGSTGQFWEIVRDRQLGETPPTDIEIPSGLHREVRHVLLRKARHRFRLLRNASSGVTLKTLLLTNFAERYERAKRERTLRTIAVERQIALAATHLKHDVVPEGTPSPQRLVERTIALLQHQLERRRRAAAFAASRGDAAAETSAREHEELVRYAILAVRKNRPFLLEFWSRVGEPPSKQ